MRGKPEKFAEHYTQATLFYNSQTPVEKAHIVGAFRFELTKVQIPAVRERVVAMLRNVDEELARSVADGLGIGAAGAAAAESLKRAPKPEVKVSPALSLFARPGDGGIATRRIAILVADGVDGAARDRAARLPAERGAVPRFVGARLGTVERSDGDAIEVEVTLETMPGGAVRRAGPAGRRGGGEGARRTSATRSSSSRTSTGMPSLYWCWARRRLCSRHSAFR